MFWFAVGQPDGGLVPLQKIRKQGHPGSRCGLVAIIRAECEQARMMGTSGRLWRRSAAQRSPPCALRQTEPKTPSNEIRQTARKNTGRRQASGIHQRAKRPCRAAESQSRSPAHREVLSEEELPNKRSPTGDHTRSRRPCKRPPFWAHFPKHMCRWRPRAACHGSD